MIKELNELVTCATGFSMSVQANSRAYCYPQEKVTISTTDYGVKFASSLQKDNVWAVQFHPEKSQRIGLKVLSNFLKLC